jgi:hypothetical protein
LKKIIEHIHLLFNMLITALKHPRSFVRRVSTSKIRALINALKHEPPSVIIHNFRKLLLPPTDSFHNQTGAEDFQKGLYLYCDGVFFHPNDNSIELHGWALAQNGIKKIEISQGRKRLGFAKYGVPRPDVLAAYPQFGKDQKPGYSFRKNYKKGKEEEFTIKVYDKLGQTLVVARKIEPSQKGISLNEQYQIFLQQNKRTSIALSELRKLASQLTYQPKISIITPVFNVPQEYLNPCIQSVLNQVYENWELCLYDDASSDQETVDCLKSWIGKDPRIKIEFGKTNQHISGASNEAVKIASGEFIGLLDHDDELTPDALLEVVRVLNSNPELDFIYSDEDKKEPDGSLSEPHFKPDFSIDLLLSVNYICHFTVIRKKNRRQNRMVPERL